ncbi:MAG TPA: hypothetical protein ENN65_07245 [Candidatus Hydrogenedentes bacterium]|nr:hypothetical protein [Candidatus Hydrogenedentota bacterium]
MKTVVLALIGLLSFAATLGVSLFMTGNLSMDAVQRVFGQAPPPPIEAAPPDPLAPLVQQVKRRESALQQREQELKQRESQLAQREQELTQLQKRLEDLQKQIDDSLADAEKERKVRLETVANTVAVMKPDKAAERLEQLPIEDVAEILHLVKPKERGKIVEAMTSDRAGLILRALQERRL